MPRRIALIAFAVVLAGAGLTSRATAAPDAISRAQPGARAVRTGDVSSEQSFCPPVVAYNLGATDLGVTTLGPLRYVRHQFDGDVTDDPIVPGIRRSDRPFFNGAGVEALSSQDCSTLYLWRGSGLARFDLLDPMTGSRTGSLTTQRLGTRIPPPQVLADGSVVTVRDSSAGALEVRDAETGSLVWSAPGAAPRGISHSSFRLDGDRVAIAGFNDANARVIDRATGHIVETPAPIPLPLNSLDLSWDGRHLLVTGLYRTLLMTWEGEILRSIGQPGQGGQAWSGFVDYNEFVVCNEDGMVRQTLEGDVTATEEFATVTTDSVVGPIDFNLGLEACVNAVSSSVRREVI